MALSQNAIASEGVALGDVVPFFTLKALNSSAGTPSYIGLNNLVGESARTPKKSVLLSFFATYCEPCKKELPFLAKLHQLYEKDGFTAIVVTIDKEGEKIEEAKKLAEEHGVRFPLLSDRFNIVAKRYQVSNLPSLFLVDRVGRATMIESGYTSGISKKLLAQIRQSLGMPTAAPIPPQLQPFFPAAKSSESTGIDESFRKQRSMRVKPKNKARRSAKNLPK